MTNTILFAGGEDSEVTLLSASMTTLAGTFRSAYARSAISCRAFDPNGAEHVFAGDLAAYLAAQPSNDKDFWYGYRFKGGGGFLTQQIGLKVLDGSTTPKPFIQLLSGPSASDIRLRTSTNGTAWTDYPTSAIAQPSTPAEYCFRIKIHASLGTIEWWINGGLWFATPVGDTTGLCTGNPSKVIFGCPNSNSDAYYSEIRATAASRPCVGMDVYTANYTADGDEVDWIGGVASINGITEDTTTTLRTSTANQKSSFVARDLPNLGAGIGVLAVVNSGRWRTAVGAPQNLDQYLRIGGTNYYATTRAVQATPGTIQSIWENSPATGVPFTEAEWNATQPGMKSVT